jgi:hypothetical protein
VISSSRPLIVDRVPMPCLYLSVLSRYGLADNEDNIPDIIKFGALLRLMDCSEKLTVQASKVGSACLMSSYPQVLQ